MSALVSAYRIEHPVVGAIAIVDGISRLLHQFLELYAPLLELRFTGEPYAVAQLLLVLQRREVLLKLSS